MDLGSPVYESSAISGPHVKNSAYTDVLRRATAEKCCLARIWHSLQLTYCGDDNCRRTKK